MIYKPLRLGVRTLKLLNSSRFISTYLVFKYRNPPFSLFPIWVLCLQTLLITWLYKSIVFILNSSFLHFLLYSYRTDLSVWYRLPTGHYSVNQLGYDFDKNMVFNKLLHGVILSERSFIGSYAQVVMKFIPPVIPHRIQNQSWCGVRNYSLVYMKRFESNMGTVA